MPAAPGSVTPLPDGVTDANYVPLPGRRGNMSAEQAAALAQLKKEVEAEGALVPERMDDDMFLRFLRARQFDVPKSKLMLLDAEKWRKEFGVDDIMKNFDFTEAAEVDKYYPQYYHKNDKEGRPVFIQVLGKLDVPKLYKITTQERQLQRLVMEYELFLSDRLPASGKAVGHPVETSCTILDLKNVSLTSFYKVKDYVSAASAIGQSRYPETMGKFYIINAPWGFGTVWSLIKPWLDPVTVSKIDIASSPNKAVLLDQIPAENLPVQFGGTCDCPGGCSLSNAGPWNTKDTPAAPAPAEAPAPAA